MSKVIQFIGVGTVLIHNNDLKHIDHKSKNPSAYDFDKPYVVTKVIKSTERGQGGSRFEIMGIYSDGIHSRQSGLTLDEIRANYTIYPKPLSELHLKLKRKAMEYKPISMTEAREIISDLFNKGKRLGKHVNLKAECDCEVCMPELYCVACGNYLPEFGTKDDEWCTPCQIDASEQYFEDR